ncbi:MAG: helix-turn-helix transcriptional regulator [Candidatus Adiutrix sp.]|jgi:DNA-binding CsgD family transcriptional regulator|nr:helix-turn-helix transcriptional regulator [Candidatus Adiutrix sp.]
MNVKNMDYKTVKETAEAWGVSGRYVTMCIKNNRIEGAARFGGKSWMIPSGAVKPASGRGNKTQKSLESELMEVIRAVYIPAPLDEPDSVINMVQDERLRVIPEIALAYVRGDFEYIKRRYLAIEETGAVKLCAGQAAIAAAISLGDYPFFLEVETYLKGVVKASEGPAVTACAELALGSAYMGAGATALAPDWLKSWNFSALPEPARPSAIRLGLENLRWRKSYEIMLAAAQASLAFCVSEHYLTYEETYFRLLCATACYALNREDDAERHLLSAMAKTLPHGFITPFAERLPVFGCLLERLLQREFPSSYNAVLKQSKRTVVNWLAFHNRFMNNNIPLILSLREHEIALLVARHTSRAKIAKHYHISVSAVNNIIERIYEKLGVSGRNKLAELII